jgi:hypothetical protein
MAVFRNSENTFVAPWLALREAGSAQIVVDGTSYNLTVTDTGELTISDDSGNTFPFYFEMWFSVAVQHPDSLIVINP